MAVWDCDSSKSPGPDGFNFKFIKSFWETVKEDIVRMMKEFHANGKLPKGTNSTFITLIPKVDDPQTLGDYRPISLVGCLYKILAKILANRLKKVLPSVIDDRQSAFLEGTNLLQSVVIANETLDEVKKEKKSCTFFKVDYEKAYDSVNWEFLLYMLRRLGFDTKWIQWIRACLESAHVSVLINGSPSEEFKMSRGLRQGDPLSPFLFTIVVEGLTGLMREWVDDTWVWEFRWRRERFDWEANQILTLHQILNTFSMKKLKNDYWYWKLEPSREFSVKSAYKLLTSQRTTNERQKLFVCMWKLHVPPKVSLFVWRLLINALPTKENLLRRNIQVEPQHRLCVFCRASLETAPHLFCTCSKVVTIWDQWLTWLNCPAP
uniref:Transposon TX1 uncharacterized n=1 Tax=Cajanus cajan TaxID=3821 RepID=A0A151SR09_CAJCA|nr:Transposon TX1 uncharacterized [Cajanus cajan]